MTEPDAWEYDRVDDDILCPKLVQDEITAEKFGDSKKPLFSPSSIEEIVDRRISSMEEVIEKRDDSDRVEKAKTVKFELENLKKDFKQKGGEK